MAGGEARGSGKKLESRSEEWVKKNSGDKHEDTHAPLPSSFAMLSLRRCNRDALALSSAATDGQCLVREWARLHSYHSFVNNELPLEKVEQLFGLHSLGYHNHSSLN